MGEKTTKRIFFCRMINNIAQLLSLTGVHKITSKPSICAFLLLLKAIFGSQLGKKETENAGNYV